MKKSSMLILIIAFFSLWFGVAVNAEHEILELEPEQQDYIHERPLTEEEIEEQKAMEPRNLFSWEDDIVVPSLGSGKLSRFNMPTTFALPIKYDARDENVITSVKDQGIYGTCWAISAAAMAETSILKKGGVINGESFDARTLDLSEHHFSYFFYHSVPDSMGNTLGDKTINTMSDVRSYLDAGGNHMFSTFALANRTGLAKESLAPWQTVLEDESDDIKLDDSIAYSNSVYLDRAYWINFLDTNDVKQAILDYGCVGAAHYYGSSYHNYSTAAYYCTVNRSDNHSVIIVGWDDTYSAANFNSDPGVDGAWLVKNSYGQDWGMDGYYWISYADFSLNNKTAKAYVFDFVSTDTYDNYYQYDGTAGRYIGDTGSTYVNQVNSGGSISNVFKVPENATALEETLRGVSFSLFDANVMYEIQIYKNLTDQDNPLSGETLLSLPITGITSHTGLYTVPLTEEVILRRGDTFAIVVSLQSQMNSPITYFADYTYKNGGWIAFESATKEKQSFEYNGNWRDLHEFGAAARIKAYTKNTLMPAKFQVDIDATPQEGGVVSGGGQKVESENVTVKAVANGGYEFEYWMEGPEIVSEEADYTIESIDRNWNLTASFKLIENESDKEIEIPEVKQEEELEDTNPPLTNASDTKEPNQKPTVNKKEAVKTGDETNIEFYVILLIISLVLMVFSYLKYMKKEV